MLLGWEGIFLHHLSIHKEGQRKEPFKTRWHTLKTQTGSECSV